MNFLRNNIKILYLSVVYTILLLAFPLMVVPISCFVIIFRSGKSRYQSQIINRATVKRSSHRLIGNLKTLCERDSLFDLDKFEGQVENVFQTLQSAWSNKDMTTIRRFVSDSTFERLSILDRMYEENGIRNSVSDVKVLECTAEIVESDTLYDTIKVRISASSVDYFTSLDGYRTYGLKRPEQFTELWSFIRKRGTKSLETGGLMSGYCPNCGNPLELNDKANCVSCNSIITSGQYDWILAEIIQINVYSSSSNLQVFNYKKLMEQDPGFNIQSVEDKVSTAFWSIRYSEFVNDYYFSRRFVTDEFLNDHSVIGKCDEWEIHADAVVASVDLLDFYPATTDGFDRIRVKISWSARKIMKERGATFIPDYSCSMSLAHEFILKRCKNVKTPAGSEMMSLHCPNCGAPTNEKSTSICEYCNTSFVDGSRDWVIENIQPFAGYTKVKRETVQKPPGNLGFFEDKLVAVIYIMLADGIIDSKELEALRSLSRKYGYNDENLQVLIKGVKAGTITADLPDNNQDSLEFLLGVIKMALADGRICNKERTLINLFAKQLGFVTEFDINQLMRRAKNELYLESKEVLKFIREGDFSS